MDTTTDTDYEAAFEAGQDAARPDDAQLVEFGKAWAGLGAAIAEQVEQVLSEGPDAEVNPNAIEHAIRALKRVDLAEYMVADLEIWLAKDSGGGQ